LVGEIESRPLIALRYFALRRRLVGWLAIVLGLALAAPAAASALTGYPQVAAPSAAAHAGDLGLQPCAFHSKEDGKNYLADCGQMVVPEDRRGTRSRLIELPLIRIRATGPNPAEPIFTFQGGPGASNIIDFAIDGLLARHDVVMVGYRGVDGGVNLDCPEVSDHIAAAKGPLMGPAALASIRAGARPCAARLLRAGVDLAGYSMPETVDDQELARRALGYGPIDLLGGSYGTRLELIYEWRYPASLRRVVMIGANPPGHFVWDPKLTDAKLDRYALLCADDRYCRARTTDLRASLRRVSANMPTGWMGVPIDPDRVRFLSFFMLPESIDPKSAPVPLSGPAAIDMWLSAASGDASGMALLSAISHPVLPRLINNWGEFLAMGAGDYARLTPAQVDDLTPTDVIVGAPSRLFWEMARDWPANADADAYSVMQPSAVETLVVAGTLDFTTPIETVRSELMPKLSHGSLVSLAEFGHTASFWGSQPAARDRLLATFFDKGQVDASLYVRQPPVFQVANGLSALAHRILLIAVFTAGVLIGAVWFVVRRRGRRRRIAEP
jgi:pimeloyl-ACP methyl ester carboxylesterase